MANYAGSARVMAPIVWRGWRGNLARRSPCEISPTASPMIAYGRLRRGLRADNRAAASICPTSSKGARLTCRQASRRSGWSRGEVRTKQKGGIRCGEGLGHANTKALARLESGLRSGLTDDETGAPAPDGDADR